MESRCHLLDAILKGGHIKAVYQPIVSLTNGRVYGYEALSRISEKKLEMNIEQMFKLADKMGKSWELETLCRTRTLESFKAKHKKYSRKLFINVNSNIIYDEKFKEGFTRRHLGASGLDASTIIFEITERAYVVDNSAFLASIDHYKSQEYGIAIDDVGAGYSGLNVIASVKPNFIKLDMNLVRNIDKDETKQLLCKAMVDFGKGANILLIAEGIETEEELETLIRLHVDFGQGYFLGLPQESPGELAPEKIALIRKLHDKKHIERTTGSLYPIIGHLARPGCVFSADESANKIYEAIKLNPTITEFAIVQDGVAMGFMTRTALNELFGGMYGYSLNAKKNIRQMMEREFLKVNYHMPVDQVSRLAMQRPFEHVYDSIVVEKDNRYSGMVTIRDLLNMCTKIEVKKALQVNPLTELPGNLVIESEILIRVTGERPYCITYYDIDNFKAYNDAYGFQNGDVMLALLADILKKSAGGREFIGHIGGDDFIVICDYHEGEDYAQAVVDSFAIRVKSLYRDEDVANGFITSKNRHGVTEDFPIASLSVAGVSNRANRYSSVDDFVKDIAVLKKQCKQRQGNCVMVI